MLFSSHVIIFIFLLKKGEREGGGTFKIIIFSQNPDAIKLFHVLGCSHTEKVLYFFFVKPLRGLRGERVCTSKPVSYVNN